ncbi:Protein tyrosine phosphatase type IVA 1 [Apophysomyces sp. BC1034]|nr:Protein tyrosine phosphatase type IVA 1 [Apophysomyces sp. BC1021]KAG0185122.1 Protein tyrosine phosphatase type IVA 1 [Apophysomyces sp. BC1034]
MVNSYTRSDSPLGRMLSLIKVPSSPLRFLILDCPTESTLPYYLEEFKRFNVTNVVRCCQQTYSATKLVDHGIQVHDLPFKDGGVPPPAVVREWLALVDSQERIAKADELAEPTIAVHCVAGLGRAPALVAIALIELGMQPLDAVEYVRRKRRGAFNKPQIAYLDTYKRTLKTKSSSGSSLKSSLGRMFKFGRADKQEVAIH